jgi:uncharacterized membrane protein
MISIKCRGGEKMDNMDNKENQSHKSSFFDMGANKLVIIMLIIISVLFWISYVKYFAWIIPILIFLIEKQSKLVKYYAVQTFFICILRAVISLLLSLIGYVISLKDLQGMSTDAANRWLSAAVLPSEIDIFVGIGFIVLVLYLVIRTSEYARIKLPLIGEIAENISKVYEDENE